MLRALCMCAATLLALPLAAAETVTEHGSLMLLDVPLEAFPSQPGVFQTRDLAVHSCEGVAIEKLQIEKRLRKNLDAEIRFEIIARPTAGVDREAVLVMELRNDSGPLVIGERRGEAKLKDKVIARLPEELQGILRTAGTPGTTRVCVLLRAETRRSRPARLTCYVRDEQLHALIEGPNPRLVLMLGVLGQ